MNLKKQFMEGLLTQNPVLVQVLGMCSTMAITTSFFNGLGMGVAVLVILTLSNIIIAAIRKIIPDKIRIAMLRGDRRFRYHGRSAAAGIHSCSG